MTFPAPIRRLPRLLATVALTVSTALMALAAPAPGSDEAAVFAAAGLTARDGTHHRAGCPTAFKPATERIDINRDGRDEIALFLGSSACFGQSLGGNVALFMRGADGGWTELLGYAPGVELVPVGGSTQGFIDLGLASPGGCMAVMRWNGQAYVHALNRAIEPGGCQFR